MLKAYSFFLRLYVLGIRCAALWNSRAKGLISGRRNQWQGIADWREKQAGKKIIWLHADSYGEFEMARPLLTAMDALPYDHALAVSFFSPSGYENVKFDSVVLKFYLPFDLAGTQEKLIDILKPDVVLFMKNAIWFNLLDVLVRHEIPFIYAGFHLVPGKKLSWPVIRPLTSQLNKAFAILTKSKISTDYLTSIGFNNTRFWGDTRVNQAFENRDNPGKLPGKLMRYLESGEIIVLGNLMPEDFGIASAFVNAHAGTKILLVPHDIDTKTVQRLGSLLKTGFDLWTTSGDVIQSSVLIYDVMGDLRYLYRYAHWAFIGGGFGQGPHNIIEPLVYGIPVACGPAMNHFPFAEEAVRANFLCPVKDIRALNAFHEAAGTRDMGIFNQHTQAFLEANQADLNIFTSILHEALKKDQ